MLIIRTYTTVTSDIIYLRLNVTESINEQIGWKMTYLWSINAVFVRRNDKILKWIKQDL